MTDLERAILHIKTRADAWAVKEIEKALSQEPTDAISREAVQKAINCWIGSGEYRYAMSERFLIDRINDLPSVTQKSGKWVLNVHDIPICSQCGYMTPYDRVIDDYEYGNFCPNCGAKMESEDKE